MNEYIRRSHTRLGAPARRLAFRIIPVVLIGTLFGSLLPETGDLLALRLGIWPHDFNVVFLTLGFLGLNLALYLGRTSRRVRT